MRHIIETFRYPTPPASASVSATVGALSLSLKRSIQSRKQIGAERAITAILIWAMARLATAALASNFSVMAPSSTPRGRLTAITRKFATRPF